MNIKTDIEKELEDLIKIRRCLHKNAEIGFELKNTLKIVKENLKEFGYEPIECGKCGLYIDLDNEKDKTILFRCDMDALPITEETNLEFSSKVNMHACGHDLHTTFILGCAKVLQKYKDYLNVNIRFMFQPAEEILSGAKDMIENKILDNISEAYMSHIMTGTNLETGTFVVPGGGVIAPSSDYFKIEVKGKSCHGAMPNTGIDPIMITEYLIILLSNIKERELSSSDNFIMTFGSINSGNSYNVIPDITVLKGTMRTYDEEVRLYVKRRINEIIEGLKQIFKCDICIEYQYSCPVFKNDEVLSRNIYNILKENEELNVIGVDELGRENKSAGSEDFAYVSQLIPTSLVNISAGSIQEGYDMPLHNPKTLANENVIYYGVLLFCLIALSYK